MNDSAKLWYLIYTKPRQEEVARTHLERQGYTVYLPRVRQMRRRLGQRVMATEPLFPRYLFIQLDTQADNWGPIRSTLGVTSLVSFGSQPALIPNALIRFLMQREGQTGLHEWAESNYLEGERIQIVDGALRGYAGIFLAHSGRERAVVLLEILGRPVRMQATLGQLERY